MLLRELFESHDLPFDLLDDLLVFMQNDPEFYRLRVFPAIDKIQRHVNAKKGIDIREELVSVVNDAVPIYCKKFHIQKDPKTLLSNSDKVELAKALYAKEKDNAK